MLLKCSLKNGCYINCVTAIHEDQESKRFALLLGVILKMQYARMGHLSN